MAKRDPEILTNCLFYLELTLKGSKNPVDAVFLECKGFKHTQEVIEACEVIPEKWGQKASVGRVVRTKIPGNTKVNNIVLRRGMSASDTLWKWFDAVQTGNWGQQRRDGSLTVYDQARQPQARFEFSRAWPTNYTITDVNAAGNDVEIEELELVCEDFKRVQ